MNASSWSLLVDGRTASDQIRVTTVPAEAANGRIRVTAENFVVQEGARRFAVDSGMAGVSLRNFEAIDLDRETNADIQLLFTAKVWDAPDSATIGTGSADDETQIAMNLPESTDWVRYGIPLKCFRQNGADMTALTHPFVLTTQGRTDYAIGEVRLGTDAEVVLPCS